MPRTLLAVDTNVLFDLAAGAETVIDALTTIRQRITGARFIVPPAILQEVALIATRGDTPAKRALANSALAKLRPEWRFEPVNLEPVGHGIAERIADELAHRDFLPVEERNDALLLASTFAESISSALPFSCRNSTWPARSSLRHEKSSTSSACKLLRAVCVSSKWAIRNRALLNDGRI